MNSARMAHRAVTSLAIAFAGAGLAFGDVVHGPLPMEVSGEGAVSLTLADGQRKTIRFAGLTTSSSSCDKLQAVLVARGQMGQAPVIYDLELRVDSNALDESSAAFEQRARVKAVTVSSVSTLWEGRETPIVPRGSVVRQGNSWRVNLDWRVRPTNDFIATDEQTAAQIAESQQPLAVDRRPDWLDQTTGAHGAVIAEATISVRADVPAMDYVQPDPTSSDGIYVECS